MIKIVYDGKMDPVTAKEVFSKVLPEILDNNPDTIYLDADLMSCISMLKYGAAHPDRAIDCGIAEANMVGVACGMAAAGFKPYVHSFGPFASRRCFDQAFLSSGYAGNDITIIGSDAGICAAYNGGTHMPFEDMALYCSLPGSTVIDITDSAMLADILRQVKDRPGTKYIRSNRKNNAKVYETGSEFEIGKGIVLKEGTDAVIIASGIMVHEAMQAAEKLKADGIDAAVIDMFTVKPVDAELIEKYAKSTGAVVTAENHNRIGGLTAAVSAVLSTRCPVPMEYVAVEDEFGEVGPQDYLRERFALTDDHIVRKVKAAIARK